MLQETVARTAGLPGIEPADRRLQRESSLHGGRAAARAGHRAAGDRARAGGSQHGAGRGDRRAARIAARRRTSRSGPARAAGRSRDRRRGGVPRRGGRGPRGGRGGQPRDLRRRPGSRRDRLRLHPPRGGHRTGVHRRRIRREARRGDGRAATSSPASTTGTAACSCSARASYLAELGRHAPAMLAACRAALAGRRPRSRLPATAGAGVRSAVRPIRSTTRSWRRPRRRSWCRSTRAGATSGPGRRCRCAAARRGRQRDGRRRADRGHERLLPALDEPSRRGRRVSATMSWSRPRTPCSSRRATACRTSSSWSQSSRRAAATRPRSIARCTGPGAATTASTAASASRSSA